MLAGRGKKKRSLTRNEPETRKRAPSVCLASRINTGMARVWRFPSTQPPVTLLIGVDSKASWAPWCELCALCSILSSPWLLSKRPYSAAPKYPSLQHPICVCLCSCPVPSCPRPALNSTTSLRSLRQSDHYTYTLCERAFIIILLLFSFYPIRTFALICFEFRRIFIYCCMFVSASTVVPMHTCQAVPLKTDSHHTYLPCLPQLLQTGSR